MEASETLSRDGKDGGAAEEEEEDDDNSYDDSATEAAIELFDEWLEEEMDDLPDDELFELSSDEEDPPLHHKLLVMGMKELHLRRLTEGSGDNSSNSSNRDGAEKAASVDNTRERQHHQEDNTSSGRRRSARVDSLRATLPNFLTSSKSLRASTDPPDDLRERMESAALGKTRERAASKSYALERRRGTSRLGVTLQLPNGMNEPMTLNVANNITVEQMKTLLFQKTPSLKMLDPTQFYIGIDETTVFTAETMNFLKCHPTTTTSTTTTTTTNTGKEPMEEADTQFKLGIYPKLNEGSNKDRNVGSLPLHALKSSFTSSLPSTPLNSGTSMGTPRRHQLQIGNRTAR
eukprot:TRINITY_DN1516_c0_g4_i2.p1 TRINITY_DN1516_c0_g4~~TRINITY_DN1516_c0_g4_i2.p1  ORF type:complete len:347 (+),score=85.46 TRINITY_DN1516_c0_g4_i2:233-1273(+)